MMPRLNPAPWTVEDVATLAGPEADAAAMREIKDAAEALGIDAEALAKIAQPGRGSLAGVRAVLRRRVEEAEYLLAQRRIELIEYERAAEIVNGPRIARED